MCLNPSKKKGSKVLSHAKLFKMGVVFGCENVFSVVRMLLVAMPGAPFVASLLLVAMPFVATSVFALNSVY